MDNSILKLDSINYIIDKETEINNISKEAEEQLNRSRVVINKPVKWLKKVKLSEVKSNVAINITSDATNITVKKIKNNIPEEIPQEKIKIRDKGEIKELIEYETGIKDLKQEKTVNLITGNVILEDNGNTNSTEIIIEDPVEEVEIEYYTEGPTSEEITLAENKKQIVISSDIHYEDILAFTFLPREIDSGAVKLYWIINESKINVNIDGYDTNDNNLVDYIEWNVPSLSSKTYELIIEISKAEHLDSNRVFIEDVYDLVRARDDNWTDKIPTNHYIRVTFERSLTNDKDISIYARSDQDATIEVYEKDQNNSIATFENINEDKKYRILLTNLVDSQDVFDLKIIDNPVEFDYIVDPDTTLPIINGTLNKSLNNILEIDIINATFNATDNINLTNASIVINDTGFNRYFNFSLNGSSLITLEFSQNFTVNCSSGCVINVTGIARDNSSNEAQNETLITVLDITPPSAFDLIFPADGTRSTDLTPSLDWENTTEPNFENYTIEFSTSSSFSFINHTFKPEGNVTNSSFTLTTSLTPNLNWTWRVIAYDNVGNSKISTSAFRYETFQNRKPTTPNNALPSNTTIKFYNDINFTWTQSIDLDNDDISYDLLIAKDTSFTDIDLNKTGITVNYFDLEENGSTLSNDKRYWKVRAYDDANYSDYSAYFDLTVIVAILNITAPANDTKFYPTNTTEVTISELNGTDWINNVTVQINNTNYTASNTGDTWAVNVTFSSLTPQFLNITAYGYNRTDNLTTTIKKQIIFSKINSVPDINYICSNETYALNSTNRTITLKTTLEALINTTNVTIINPSNIVIELNSTSSTKENLVYTFNYLHFLNETGNYTLNATVTDIEDNSFNKISVFQVVTAVKTINVSGVNINNINFNDICTNEPVSNGISLLVTIPDIALYNVEVKTAKPTVTFSNLNLTNTTKLLNYTDLVKNISAPSGQRIVTEFEISSNITKYDNVTVSYNYTSIEGALDDETGLRMYKCNSQASCTWSLLTTTLNTTTNIISTTTTSLSVFLVSETAETTTTEIVTETITSTTSAAAGGGGGSIVTKAASLDLIVPSPISLYTQDKVIVPIILKNPGELKLNKINLSSEVKADGITIEIEDTSFESLNIDETVSTNAIITTDVEQFGKNKITITANVSNPRLTEYADIIIDIIDIYKGNKTLVEEKIKFSLDLFKQNPECLELKELLNQAEASLEKNEFKKSLVLIESAINACERIVGKGLIGRGLIPSTLEKQEFFDFKIILTLVAAVLLIVFTIAIYWSRTRLKSAFKFSNLRIGPTKKEFKKFANEEKEIGKMLRRGGP
jgi:hypothetical protein